jgi:uncharacterized membrane protein YfcA
LLKVGVRIGLRAAQKMSSEFQALIFNGMSVVLIPSYFLVQQHTESIGKKREKPISDSFDSLMIAKSSVFGVFLGSITSIMGVGGLPMVMSFLTLATECPHHLIQVT